MGAPERAAETPAAPDATGADPLVDRLLKQDLGLVLYERSPDGTLPFLALTPNVEAVTGFAAGRFVDEPHFWLSHVHPDDRERVLTDVEMLFERGTHRDEYRWRVADGSYRWFADVLRLGMHPDGSAARVVGCWSDITDRKRREDAHRQSEARYRAVVEDQTELICRFLPDGTLTFVNDAFCRYFDRAPEELLGRSFIPLLPIADREPMRRHLRWFAPERPMAVIEHQVPSASGEMRWQRRVDRALFGSDGQIVLFQSVAHDITELKRAEETLRDSELRYRTLVEHAYDLICEVDEAGTILYASPSLHDVVGIAGDRLVGSNVFDRVHADERASVRALLSRSATEPVRGQSTVRVRRHDDAWRWVEWTGKTYLAQGGQLRGVLVGRDVTDRLASLEEQRRLEEAVRRAELLSAMGSLVGGVAHQVRNPLFAISSTLDAFTARFGDDEATARYAEVLREEVGRLNGLMQQLLEYGKPAAAELTRQTLAPIVEAGARACGARAASRDVAVDTRLDPDVSVRAQPERLAMVFENLIDNAVQHSPDGGVVEVDLGEESTGRVTCRVRDHGPGIPEDALDSIFEPFYSERRGGVGLGLSIVQRIVEAHGGRVRALNRDDGGAEISVTLPLATPER